MIWIQAFIKKFILKYKLMENQFEASGLKYCNCSMWVIQSHCVTHHIWRGIDNLLHEDNPFFWR